jgi:hypothetical protein
MAIDNLILKKKTSGIMQAIEKLSHFEREKHPTHLLGEDYNKLLNEIEATNPHLKDILPPKTQFLKFTGGRHVTSQTFGEILVYTTQLYHLLSND